MAIGIYLRKKPLQKVSPQSSGGKDVEIPAVTPADDPALACAIINTAPELTDVFLTHDWGKDEEGRDNHTRVCKHAECHFICKLEDYHIDKQLYDFICSPFYSLGLNRTIARIRALG